MGVGQAIVDELQTRESLSRARDAREHRQFPRTVPLSFLREAGQERHDFGDSR